MNDLILSNAISSRRGTINNTSGLAAAHAAQQEAVRGQNEDIAANLGLAKKRLSEDQRQFDLGLGFKKDQMDQAEKYGTIANVISGVGLGLEGANSLAQRSRTAERLKYKQGLIDRYSKLGDERSLFLAEMLKYLG